jgi:hypothetical protein
MTPQQLRHSLGYAKMTKGLGRSLAHSRKRLAHLRHTAAGSDFVVDPIEAEIEEAEGKRFLREHQRTLIQVDIEIQEASANTQVPHLRVRF